MQNSNQNSCPECEKNSESLLYRPMMQNGGQQKEQMMQIIMAYAQLHQVKPEEVIQQIQKLNPEQQQQVMQTMITELQGNQGSGQPDSQQTQSPQEGGFSHGGNIPEGNPYGGDEYRYDYGGNYPVSGITGLGESAGRGLPYAVPMINAATGDAPMFEPLKAITGFMGAATSLAGAGLGFGKAAQWAGNKLLPEGKFKSGFNSALNTTNDFTKNVMDIGSDLNFSGLYENQIKNKLNNLQQNTRPLDQKYIREARNEKGPNLYYSKPINGPEYQGQYDTMVAEYGGGINNPGFRALPEHVQQNIIDNMSSGGEKMPPEIARARFAAAGNIDQLEDYGYAYGGYISPVDMYANGGYTVRKSNDRKGKTHVVTGPDGTKKYFGDPNMGERSKSKNGKDAFYARHATNLKNNPYFRAYARSTWEDGGALPQAQFGFSNPQGPPYAQQNNIPDPNEFPQNNTTDAFTRSQGQQAYGQYNNAVRSFSNPFDTNNMSQFDLNNFNKNKIPFPKPPQAPEDYTVDESQFPQRQGNDMASMMNQDDQIVGKAFENENNLNPLPGTQAKSTDFNGMDYAQKANAGAGAFLNYLQYKNNRGKKIEYDEMKKRKGNTDYGIANNTPSQGNYTLNVGFQNFQPGKTTPIQSVTGKYGGTLNRKQYKSGGEYQVSEDELLQLMRDGAEIEFINK